jgi:hypothetical protein
MKPELKAPGIKRSKLKHDDSLLNFAFKFNLSRYIEAHAVDTYAQFADQNKVALRQLPPPRIAKVGPSQFFRIPQMAVANA